jgi:excinuclease UvrABC nuclease subunit
MKMAATTIRLEFDGFWRDVNKAGIPAQSGVYCVYECRYDAETKKVTLLKLIYIGEADDAQARVAQHEKYEDDWSPLVGTGNTLCFAFAPIEKAQRLRAEAALIFHHKPPVNVEYKKAFPFDQTTMALSGTTGLLDGEMKLTSATTSIDALPPLPYPTS